MYVRFPIRTLAMKKTDHLINHVFGVRNASLRAVLIQPRDDTPIGMLEYIIQVEICHKELPVTPLSS